MDNPTNDLDIYSVESLLIGLQVFNGGIVVSSNDLWFLQNLCNEIYELKDGKLVPA